MKIHTYIRRLFLFGVLLLPNLYAVLRVTDLTFAPAKTVVYALVVVVCLLLPALFLKSRTYFIAEGVLNVFCAPIEIASIFLNKATTTPVFLKFVYSTHLHEAAELVMSLWYVALLIVAVWILYFVLASREPHDWLLPRLARIIVLAAVPVLVIGGMALFSFLQLRMNKNETTVVQFVIDAADKSLMKFNKIFPYNFYINTSRIIRQERRTRRLRRESEAFSFRIQPVTDSIPRLVVLVIGEAARSDHFSLNGYERNTNPRLGGRRNIVSCQRAYSQGNCTSDAVPHILSRIEVQWKDRLYSEKSVTSAFTEAGFDFAWLGNQPEGTYTAVAAKQAGFHYVSTKDWSAVDNFDTNLLDEFDNAIRALDNSKKLVVMHTMGSHWQYNNRYPADFDVFKPSLDRTFNLTKFSVEVKEKLVNSYDNSILYTDFFLDSLISVLEARHEPALMLYISDHGENLYDDEQGLVFHGSYIGSEYEYHVPFIVWYSDEYAGLYPDKTTALNSHRDEQFNSSVVFHTLLDAADINGAADLSKSLCSLCFQPMDTMQALTGDEHLIKITKDKIIR